MYCRVRGCWGGCINNGNFHFHFWDCWIIHNLTHPSVMKPTEQLCIQSPIKWIIADGRAHVPSQHTHAQMEVCCWHILIRLFVSLISPLSQAISALLLHKQTQIESRRSIWGERSQLLYLLKRDQAQGTS